MTMQNNANPPHTSSAPWWVQEPAPEIGVKTRYRDGKLLVLIEGRRYRLHTRGTTEVVLMLWRSEEHWHLDAFSLADANACQSFIDEAARACHYTSAAIAYDLKRIAEELTRYREVFFPSPLSAHENAALH